MSARVAFIGEALLASGFALSGAQVYTPPAKADAIWNEFEQVREQADLILISEAFAEQVRERLNRYQQFNPVPPVLCVPALNQREAPVRATIQAARASLGLT